MLPLNDDNPIDSTPVATVTFVVACCMVFLYQSSLLPSRGEIFVYQYGAIPAVLFGHAALPPEVMTIPAVATVLTSMFLHGSWMHLIGNMLYLWVFGNNIEDVMGSAKFVVFYLLCGAVAAFSHALTDPTSTVPMVGASGAISGVLGAYLLLFPHARVLLFAPLVGYDLCAGRHRAGLLVRHADLERRSESRIARGRSRLLRAHRRVCRGDGPDRILQTTRRDGFRACAHLVLALLTSYRPFTHPTIPGSCRPSRAVDRVAAGSTSY